VVIGNTLYFTAGTAGARRGLWKSDGTATGTVLVKDVWADSDSGPGGLTPAGGTLFFTAASGISGRELWKSDGTPGGTVLVRDIHPGSLHSSIRYLKAAGDILFFQASDGVHGDELWRSDGTSAGTTMVEDIAGGPGGSNAVPLTRVGNTFYFRATTDAHGSELWATPVGSIGDADGDGLPDAWERTFFGSLSENGTGDPDADGQDNRFEALTGHTPTDASSLLTLDYSERTASGAQLRLSDVRPGVRYLLQGSDNLTRWKTIQTLRFPLAGTGMAVHLHDQQTSPLFFRIVVERE
jgi:ELWxxDGT repeat protein